ncbi:MAG TPA: lysophospholipid acyltransferase family protein [Thermoanaerobaculia bacterium]
MSESAVTGETPAPAPRHSRRRSAARNRAELWAYRGAVGALSLLPRGAAASLGASAALAFTRLSARRRRLLLENLRGAFPEKPPEEIERLARASARSFGAAIVNFLAIAGADVDEVRRRVSISGLEHYDEARAKGRGLLLLSAHLGGWELGAILAAIIDRPVVPVVRPLDNPLLECELARLRTRFGNRVIFKQAAAKGILKALRDNEAVVILIDQNVVASEAVFVPFFGRPAATSPAVALFQQKTGAPVVPVFVWPLPGGRYHVELQPPIHAEEFFTDGGGASREDAVLRATARYTEVTEAAIRRDPAAWLWMHDRWRTQPTKPPEDGERQTGNGTRTGR